MRGQHAIRHQEVLRAIALKCPPRIYLPGMAAQPQNADDVRKIVTDGKIEFLFAQFVDMHGKPSAKLVMSRSRLCEIKG